MSVHFPGTVGLEFEWEYPDPPAIEYELARLEAYLENTEVLMQMGMRELQADMQMKFETETDPTGRSWEELVQPEPEQIGILRRGSTNAAMYHAAISDDAWSATPVGVFFDSSVLPPYWVYHEQPEGSGQGQRIPQRAFIDASDQAQVVIEDMAEAWLITGVEMASQLVASPTTGRFLAPMGATTMLGGVARRVVKDPSTGRFVSTRPEFYAS